MVTESRADRFYSVVWPLRADVLRVALILIGNTADAEDLAQETLLKAFRFMDRLKPGSDARAWLLTILRNTRIDCLRARAKAKGQVSLASLVHDPADDSTEAGKDMNVSAVDPASLIERFGDDTILAALRSVPEDIRWALLLVDVQQMDLSEASGVLDVPVGTIKSRLHRGRAMLRQTLIGHARAMGVVGRSTGNEPDRSEQ